MTTNISKRTLYRKIKENEIEGKEDCLCQV